MIADRAKYDIYHKKQRLKEQQIYYRESTAYKNFQKNYRISEFIIILLSDTHRIEYNRPIIYDNHFTCAGIYASATINYNYPNVRHFCIADNSFCRPVLLCYKYINICTYKVSYKKDI